MCSVETSSTAGLGSAEREETASPAGSVFGTAFFALLVVASLTSFIGTMEAPLARNLRSGAAEGAASRLSGRAASQPATRLCAR